MQLRPKLLSLLLSDVKGRSANFTTSSATSFIQASSRMRSLHYKPWPLNYQRTSRIYLARPSASSVTMSRVGTASMTLLCVLLNSATSSTNLLTPSLSTTSSSSRATSAGVKRKRTLLRHRLFYTISCIRTTSMSLLPT
jgi:hypothetical protein